MTRSPLDDWNVRYSNLDAIDDATVDTPAEVLVETASAPGRSRARPRLWHGAERRMAAERGWEVVALDGAEEAIARVPKGIDGRALTATPILRRSWQRRRCM